jgi:hypothetical protein
MLMIYRLRKVLDTCVSLSGNGSLNLSSQGLVSVKGCLLYYGLQQDGKPLPCNLSQDPRLQL